jgi:hypothetical protein
MSNRVVLPACWESISGRLKRFTNSGFGFFYDQFPPGPRVSIGSIANLYENSGRYSHIVFMASIK